MNEHELFNEGIGEPGTPGRLSGDIENLLLGGNCYITVKSIKNKTQYQFRIQLSRKRVGLYFVNAKRGRDYKRLGLIGDDGFNTWSNADLPTNSKEYLCFEYLWMYRNEVPTTIEVWHEGRCCRCAKRLTDPESIARVIGPECIKKMK